MKNYLYFILISIVMFSCKNAAQYDDPIPPHDNFKIESTHLNETRVINVWTPPNYKTSTDSLPVIYMPDGGVVMEDFPHIANTISKLVSIFSIVLISNTLHVKLDSVANQNTQEAVKLFPILHYESETHM